MKEIIVAKRYAKAVVDVAKGKIPVDKVIAELQDISRIIEGSWELKNILYNPSIRMKFKEKILSMLIVRLNPSAIVKNSLLLILKKNRIKYLNKIILVLEDLSDMILNRARVKVKTAFALDEREINGLKMRFAEITKRDVIFNVEIDSTLIGGIIAQIGSNVFDGSIKNQLKSFGMMQRLHKKR